MKGQTLLVIVATVGVVATAAVAGGFGADGVSTQTNDASSLVDAATPDEEMAESITTPSPPDDTTTPTGDSADSSQTDASSVTASPDDSADTTTPMERALAQNASTTSSNAAVSDSTVENTTTENNTAPVAKTGSDRMVHERREAELDGSASSDPDGDELNYSWTQVSGPEANLTGANTSSPSFVAPDVAVWTDVVFELTVTDSNGATDNDTVVITVRSTSYPDEETDSADNGGTESDTDDTTDTEQSESTDDSDTSTWTEKSRDDIAQSVFGSDFDSLDTEDAAFAEELYLRQPADEDWDPADVRSREDIAQDRYNESFDELGFDAIVDVQSTFDEQFGDTGGDGTHTKDEITQSKWGMNFTDLSAESAGQITELYDRQPWADDKELPHIRTREQWAFRLYRSDLANLTREQRLTVEQRFHSQLTDDN
jgi:hypothetical protein